MKWENRRNVDMCNHRCYCDCPHCHSGVHCMHDDSESGECEKDECPRFKNGRWIKPKQEKREE